MAEAEGYEVSTAELAAHASQADAAADQMERARTAATEVGIGNPLMYGALCGPYVGPPISVSLDSTGAVIGQVVDLTRACAEGVRVAQQSYEDIEQAITELLERIE